MKNPSLVLDPSEIEEFNRQYDEEQKRISSSATTEQYAPSSTGDLLKGLGQGATLGFGDELLAALKAGGETALTTAKLEDLMQRYRQYQQEYESEYERARQRSPGLTLTGELAGGFLLPGGAFVKGAKALGATSKLGQAITAGGLTGALASIGAEKGGADIGELAATGAKGAALGAGLGAAATGAGKLIGKGTEGLKKYVEESPELSKLPRAFKLEKSLSELDTVGTALGTTEGQDIVYQRVQKGVNDLVDSLDTNRKFYGKKINEIYEKAKNIVPVNDKKYNSIIREVQENPELQSLLSSFNKKYTKNILDETADVRDLIELRKSILSNIKAKKLNQTITDDEVEALIGSYVVDESGAKQLAGGLVDDLNAIIETKLPELAKARADYSKAAEIPEMILNKSTDPLDHAVKLYDRSDEEIRQALKKQIGRIIGQSGGAGSQSVEQRVFLKNLKDAMASREEQRILKTNLGKNEKPKVLSAEEFSEKATALGEDLGVLKTLTGDKPLTDEALKTAVSMLSPKTLTGMGAAEAGAIAGRVTKTTAPIAKGLKRYSVDQLRGFAEMLRKNPATKQFGENAITALDNPTEAGKAAFVNQVMQNPKMRELLNLSVDKREAEKEEQE